MTKTQKNVVKKLSPRIWKTSPKMKALLGWLTGDHVTNPSIGAIICTSDKFVLAQMQDDIGFNTIISTADEFARNFRELFDLAGLTPEERQWADLKVRTAISGQEVH